jgi:hypothetical protein
MSQVNPMVIDQLRSDPDFAVDFIVDNNPEEVLAHLTGLNLLPVAPQEATKATVKNTLRTISDEETLREVLSVPYVNEQSNYTGGYQQALNLPPDAKAAGVGLAVVNGILSLGTAVAGAFTAQAQGEASIAASEASVQMQQQELDAQAAELEASKVAGIPLNAFLAIAGGVTAIIVIALLTRR